MTKFDIDKEEFAQMDTIKVIKMADDAVIPQRQTKNSVGYDICSHEEVFLRPMSRAIVSTKIQFAFIPDHCYIQVKPRSGMAAKYGITVLNTPGTIDSDYRGELKVILINLGEEDYTVKKGDRIAQMIVVPSVFFGMIAETNKIEETERGSGGFGHTGK